MFTDVQKYLPISLYKNEQKVKSKRKNKAFWTKKTFFVRGMSAKMTVHMLCRKKLFILHMKKLHVDWQNVLCYNIKRRFFSSAGFLVQTNARKRVYKRVYICIGVRITERSVF